MKNYLYKPIGFMVGLVLTSLMFMAPAAMAHGYGLGVELAKSANYTAEPIYTADANTLAQAENKAKPLSLPPSHAVALVEKTKAVPEGKLVFANGTVCYLKETSVLKPLKQGMVNSKTARMPRQRWRLA